MAEGSPSYDTEVESLGAILRRELNAEQFSRFLSILENYHQARITGTYQSSDSDLYSQRFLEVIGNRQDLRDRMMELPWVPFGPDPDVSLPPTQPSLSPEEFFQNVFLDGLERELAPDQLCRVLFIFNEAKCERAAGRLDSEACKRFFARFGEVVGDNRDVLARALVYLGSHDAAESVEIPTPAGLRNMFFIAKFTLILLRDIKSSVNAADFDRCTAIWERYQQYGFNYRYYEVASRKIFKRLKKMLRRHPRLMQIMLTAPWPHLNKSSIRRQASPSPDRNIFVRGE